MSTGWEPRAAPDAPDLEVGLAGVGVIGTGWALHFLRIGRSVVVYDPADGAAARLQTAVDEHWPTMVKLGVREGASPDRLRVVDDPAELLARVAVVQESAPEDVELKASLYEELDAMADPGVIFLSSTSGQDPTAMQSRCKHPERVAVGHPYDPPYIVPLVEVEAGEETDPLVIDWAMRFYRSHEKQPVHVRARVPGFVAGRLLETVWREALHMVAAGEATVEDIDSAMIHGPGLRMAIAGLNMQFHIAGGPGGIAHTLEHFRPFLAMPFSRLEGPPLTDELFNRIVDGCERESAGRSIAELRRRRDEGLIALLQAREQLQASGDELLGPAERA